MRKLKTHLIVPTGCRLAARLAVAVVGLGVVTSVVTNAPAHAASALPEDFTVEGRIYDDQGAPLTTAVDIKLELVDEATPSCVLYREQRPGVDLSSSDPTARGVFSLRLGAVTPNFSAGPLSALFAPGTFAGDGCAVTAAGGSHRLVRTSVRAAGAGSYETLSPDVKVTAVPLAKVAENALSLQGVGTSGLLLVNTATALNQTNLEYLFTTPNNLKLRQLVDGTSAQYIDATPNAAVGFNGQRLTSVADPTAAQDVVTKHYADATLAGRPVDLTGSGPGLGDQSVLKWSAADNKWVASAINTSPTGAAGGDLTGTYPNPTLVAGALTVGRLIASGGANRLLITDGGAGQTVGYGVCSMNQVYAWQGTGWGCANVASLSPVPSVAGRTGAIVLNAGDINGLGSAALKDYGTAPNQLPILDGAARLPAVDGSQLTNVNAVTLQSRAVASVAPVLGQVLGFNGSAWLPVTVATGGVTNVGAGVGLIGGPVTSVGTLSVDVGSAANKIVRENANAQIAQMFGTAALPAYTFAGDPGSGMFSPGTGQLALATNGTAALTIAPNGFVGVGTTAPGNLLTLSAPTYPNLSINTESTTNARTTLQFVANNVRQFEFGTDVNNVNGRDFYLVDRVAGAVRLAVASNGNVGIGTTQPTATLQITGGAGSTLRIVDGQQGNGKVLTSDGNGQAGWQSLTTIFGPTGSAGTYGSAASVPVITTDGYGRVTSVNDTPITASATTLTGLVPVASGGTGVATAAAGYVFAVPTTGAGAPAFRALTSTDATNALGFTPVNKAGDVMTGTLTVPNNVQLGKDITTGVSGSGNVLSLRSYTGSGADINVQTAGGAATNVTFKNNGYVGIGTAAPEERLHVWAPAGDAFVKATGVNAGFYAKATGQQPWNFTALNTGDARIEYGSNLEALHFTTANWVGVNTATPRSALSVEGVITPASDDTYNLGSASYRFKTVYATGSVLTSDRRLKTDITDTDLGLDFIARLRPVSYHWNSGTDHDLHYGLIAQEAEEAILKSRHAADLKSAGSPIVDHDPVSDRYGVRYTELIAPDHPRGPGLGPVAARDRSRTGRTAGRQRATAGQGRGATARPRRHQTQTGPRLDPGPRPKTPAVRNIGPHRLYMNHFGLPINSTWNVPLINIAATVFGPALAPGSRSPPSVARWSSRSPPTPPAPCPRISPSRAAFMTRAARPCPPPSTSSSNSSTKIRPTACFTASCARAWT